MTDTPDFLPYGRQAIDDDDIGGLAGGCGRRTGVDLHVSFTLLVVRRFAGGRGGGAGAAVSPHGRIHCVHPVARL